MENVKSKRYLKSMKASVSVELLKSVNAKKISKFYLSIVDKSFSREDLFEYKRGNISINDLIKKISDISENEDPEAFNMFKDAVKYINGETRNFSSYESFTLEEHGDIILLFNTEEKINNFILYFLNHTLENRVKGLVPVVLIDSYFTVDARWFLKIIEDFMVEKHKAIREDARTYISKNFMNDRKLSFLINCIFTHDYRLLDNSYMMNSKTKKAWSMSINVDKDGNEYWFKSLGFSRLGFEDRVLDIEKEAVKGELDFDTYNRFFALVEASDLRQTLFNKEALSEFKKRKNTADEILPFYGYSKENI